jgi:dCMP deaminase
MKIIEAKLNWDELFMGIAALASRRSKDPSTKHGACIVDDEHKVISIGYNGMISGNDVDYTWSRESVDGFSKYDFVVHSEENAIINATRSVKGSIMYIYSEKRYLPCKDCMKLMGQSKIKEVVLTDSIDTNTDKYDWRATLYIAKIEKIKIRLIGDKESQEAFLKISEDFKTMARMLG